MILPKTLRTDRLLLSPLAPDDVGDAYVGWLRDPSVNRFLESRHVAHDMASTRAFVSTVNSSDDAILLAIRLAGTRQHIGNIKLGFIDRLHRRADIGLLIGEASSWGRGFASEAIAAVLRLAHTDLDLAKVTASTYAANIGSIRAFLKAGFVEEGRQLRHWRSGEGWDDNVLLAHFADRES